jgi:hypothetical protein
MAISQPLLEPHANHHQGISNYGTEMYDDICLNKYRQRSSLSQLKCQTFLVLTI